MAAKNGLKGAGVAAAENLPQTFMPQLMQKLDGIEKQIGRLDGRITQLDDRVSQLERRVDARAHELEQKIDARVHELEIKMYEKLDQTRDVINELGQRINEVDTRLRTYIDINRDQTAAYRDLIERVVRIETIHGGKPTSKGRRRAG